MAYSLWAVPWLIAFGRSRPVATIAFGRSIPVAAIAIGPGTPSKRTREHTPALEGSVAAHPVAGRYAWHILLEPHCQTTAATLRILGQLQATSATIVRFCKVGFLHRQKLYAVCKPSAACEHQWCGALANVCYIRIGTKLSVVAHSHS